MPSRQPRMAEHRVGLVQLGDARGARLSRLDAEPPAATSRSSSSSCGRNSCSGGSSRRIVTGRPSMISKMPDEVVALHRQELGQRRAAGPRRRRPGSSRASATMRSGSKNMCSVRQRPMPSAPKLRAVRGVVRACRRWCAPSAVRRSSAQPISVAKSPESCGSTVGTWPEHDLARRAVDRDHVALARRVAPADA